MPDSGNGNKISIKDLTQLAVPIVAAVAFAIGGWFFSNLYQSVDELKAVVNRLGVLVEIANKQMESSKTELRDLKDHLDRMKQEQIKSSMKADGLKEDVKMLGKKIDIEINKLDQKLENLKRN